MVPKTHQFWYSRVFGMTLTKKAFKVTSLLFVLFARSAYGQSSLSLDSAAILKGTTASLNLSLNAPAGSEPASLQWKISYPLTDITALNIVAGPGLTNAAKTLSCGASAGSVSCMATGMNTNTIANDVVAVVTVTVASGTINSSDVLLFAGLMGAFPDGTLASVTGTGGTLTLLNPVPTISGLAPSSATAGTAAFNLTVTGTGFVNGSVVNWNGAARTTTFISATQLSAAISAADITNAGTAQVTIVNPTPGGGTSPGSAFAINAPNPVPTVSSLSPSSATAGSAAFTLSVTGSGFVNGSVVNWNGAARTTTFVSATKVSAAISSMDIASAGTAQVTVFNPAPGGGTTAGSTFTINASNPVPTISSLSPSSATAGGAAFTLYVTGTGFLSGSVVNWNGAARTTTFVSATQLSAAITATDIANAGTTQVTVFNPAPGGGTSAGSAFIINGLSPMPTVGNLTPSSATAGSAAFILTVNGTGFVAGSVVNWNGAARTTTFVSATKVSAAISTTDIANAGTAQVTVFNPAPGGGTSAGSTFAISNPIPTISGLSPSSATAGTAAFTLSVSGSRFVNGSVVNWNGTARTTTFVSATKVSAVIASTDIANTGTAQVTVFNPSPGGGTSAGSTFTINCPGNKRSCRTLSPSPITSFDPTHTNTVEIPSTNVLADLSCTPKTIIAGQQITCELRVHPGSAAQNIQVNSSSENLRVPSFVASRANQRQLTFQVAADRLAGEETVKITAAAGGAAVQDSVQLTPSPRPVLFAPNTKFGRPGKAVEFTVTAANPAGAPVEVSADDLPVGASFDATTGRFTWVPGNSQIGEHHLTFHARNLAGVASSAEVSLHITSVPTLYGSQKLTCSPGAVAFLNGNGLGEPDVALSDPSGSTSSLGGTRVRMNGEYLAVLSISPGQVSFLCPNYQPDTQIEATVETETGSASIAGTMQAASPMIFSMDGSGQNQGLVSFAESTALAMARNHELPAHPAQPGDQLLIWTSGIGSPAAAMLVRFGEDSAEIEAVHPVPGYAGIYAIQVRVPAGAKTGDSVRAQVQVITPDARVFTSNQVTLAVERADQ